MTLCVAIIRSSSGEFLMWPAIGAAVGVYLFYHGFRLLQRKRLIMDTPSSKIRSASMGLVELNGLATGPYTMTAPITQVPCYYYRSMAWQWQQRGKNSEWVKVADEGLHVPFYLDDNTGRVLVDPQGAEMDIHRDFHEEYSNSFFSSRPDVPSNVFAFLSRHGVSTDRKLKVEEYCIKPKNALFILGTLAQNPGLEVSATPVRSESTHQLRFSLNVPNVVEGTLLGGLGSTPGVTVNRTVIVKSVKNGVPQEVLRFTNNAKPGSATDLSQQAKVADALTKAGITSPAAWAAAGVAGPATSTHALNVTSTSASSSGSAGAAAALAPSADGFDLHPSVALMKGAHNPAFFISWRSQKDVVQSLGWKSAAMIWGGPALTLLCVYILAAYFGWL
ncbi:MAG: E3 ubiquitin ligase family protein [Acidobacteriia bacterium]|nr:E3 ubiquitin ligase family protein [Terriglobia bacterium]